MEILPHKTDSRTRAGTAQQWAGEEGKAKIKQNLDRTVQNQTKKKRQISKGQSDQNVDIGERTSSFPKAYGGPGV